MSARRIIGGLALLLGVGFGATGCGDRYQQNDLELVTAYRAKDLCSCVFVTERSEYFCRAWTVQTPNVASFVVDHDAKTVRTAAVFFWSASARYLGPEFGCVLD